MSFNCQLIGTRNFYFIFKIKKYTIFNFLTLFLFLSIYFPPNPNLGDNVFKYMYFDCRPWWGSKPSLLHPVPLLSQYF